VRILAIGNMYPPHHLGGYELVWQGAMRRARQAGHDVRILTGDYRRPGAGGVEEDGDVHRELPSHWSWEERRWVRRRAAGRLLFELRTAAALGRHLRDFDPDVVTWWSMGGLSLSMVERVRRRDLPSVLVVHDDWLVYGRREDAWIRIWEGRRRSMGRLIDRVLRLPTAVHLDVAGRYLFNSRYVEEEAARAGVRPPDSDVVHPGIDQRFLEPAPQRRWSWQLGCVGRIDVHKGVDTAIAALALLPRAKLNVIGGGHPDYIEELRVEARRAGCAERLRFLPQMTAAELRGAYAELDALLFPVRWAEPWGLVPLEAMGVGRPVVATARGGPREYLREGDNALVVPRDDPAELAGAVERLAVDAGLRDRLVAGGRRTAARFRSADFERRIVEELERAA
jgi:glycosyltransferase involved in cell wall biosynthesis